MTGKRRVAFAAVIALAPLSLAAIHTPAGAQSDEFSCRASVVRVDFTNEGAGGPLAQLGTIEPFVANAQDTPCATDDASIIKNGTALGPLGSLGLVFASTENTPNQSGTAEAGVLHLVLTLGNVVPGAPTVEVSVLTSNASATCANGEPQLSGESHVVQVKIADQTIEIPPPDANGSNHMDIGPIPLPAPIGPITIHLNEETTTPTSITEQALFVDTGLVDVVVAESQADFTGNPCSPSGNNGERFPGWMGGGGFIADADSARDTNNDGSVDPGDVVNHAFNLDCFVQAGQDPGPGHNNLVAHWTSDDGTERGGFRLLTLTDTQCSDSDASPAPPPSNFDTISGNGVGVCTVPGLGDFPATVKFTFTDNGEPGRTDHGHIEVSSPSDAAPAICSQTADGLLDGGNYQAHQTPAQRAS